MTVSTTFATEFAARVAYEAGKTNDQLTSDNFKRLERAQALFTHVDVAALLDSASVDPATINRVTKSDKRFAIYSLDKAVNVLQFVLSSAKLNEMNFYILKTALKCHAAGEAMSLDEAKAACSAGTKLNKDQKVRVVQNPKHIADSTVKSQHASTLDALVFLNVLRPTVDKLNGDRFEFQVQSPIGAKIAERLA